MNSTWTLNNSIKGGAVHDADSFHVIGVITESIINDVRGYEGQVFQISSVVTEMTRVAHCNAAELGTPEGADAAIAVRAWFSHRFEPGDDLPLELLGRDKYKRLLCDVVAHDGKLSDFILSLRGSAPMSLHEQLA